MLSPEVVPSSQMSDHAFHPVFLLLLAGTFACLLFIDEGPRKVLSPVPVSPWTVTDSANPTATFRFTSQGWQDSTAWRSDGEEAKITFIDQIHPLVWSLLIILVVYGLAILTSDEKQLRRFWSHR